MTATALKGRNIPTKGEALCWSKSLIPHSGLNDFSIPLSFFSLLSQFNAPPNLNFDIVKIEISRLLRFVFNDIQFAITERNGGEKQLKEKPILGGLKIVLLWSDRNVFGTQQCKFFTRLLYPNKCILRNSYPAPTYIMPCSLVAKICHGKLRPKLDPEQLQFAAQRFIWRITQQIFNPCTWFHNSMHLNVVCGLLPVSTAVLIQSIVC